VVTSVLVELYRHNTWATLQLIELCQSVDPAHLESTIPGTMGTIRRTLHHLVSAEESYFHSLNREPLVDPLAQDAPLAEFARRIAALGPRWEQVAEDPTAPDRDWVSRTRSRAGRGVAPMAQAIHHADVHRTHVLSILGARGLEVPDLDFWDYALQAGIVREPA
jgi:uncharacterized damage-inducible protein DinB